MTDKMITKTDLKGVRGWTDKLIREFLPSPDHEYPNTYSKKAGFVKLYSVARVESIEIHIDFIKAKEKADKRKVSGKRAVETKRAKLLLEISQYKPMVKIIERNILYEKAKEHYNNLWQYRNKTDKWQNFANPDKDFLNRIAINYLRHELSDYENKLAGIAKKIGVNDAYKIIRDKVDGAIFEAYPFLKIL